MWGKIGRGLKSDTLFSPFLFTAPSSSCSLGMSIVILQKKKNLPLVLSDISLYIMHIIIAFEGCLVWKPFMYVLGKDGQIDD